MSENDIRKKNSFLYVIRYDTSIIKDKLVRLKDLISKYDEDPKPEKWEHVKEYSQSEMKRLEEVRKYIYRHLDIIRHSVKNHRLDPGKFDYVYIKYSVDLFYDAYYMDPKYDQPGLADLISDIEDQVGQLDAALQFVDAEGTVDDKDKLERLLKVKQRQEEEAIPIEDTQRLVTEISKCSTLYCIWQFAGIRSSGPIIRIGLAAIIVVTFIHAAGSKILTRLSNVVKISGAYSLSPF